MIIKVDGGLCNRLRASLSHLSHCRHQNEDLMIVWSRNPNCNVSFRKLFEPIRGMQVIDRSHSAGRPKYVGGNVLPSEKQRYADLFQELRPIPKIQLKIEEEVRHLGENFIAIHVRRTDHVRLAIKRESFTPNEQFFQFIEQRNCGLINNEKGYDKVYLATDNKETQKLFLRKYPNLIRFYSPIERSSDLRQTSIEQAVIDLFICKHAKEFMGSGWSSFSETINHLRRSA